MRKRHRRRKNNVKKLIPVFIVLVSIMGASYSAFNTNISLTAKGTIVEKPKTMSTIVSSLSIEDTTSTVSGLYEDEYEEGRYIYRGSNPNNYIKIGKDTYRIISIEADGTIKVIKEEPI